METERKDGFIMAEAVRAVTVPSDPTDSPQLYRLCGVTGGIAGSGGEVRRCDGVTQDWARASAAAATDQDGLQDNEDNVTQ